MDEVNTKIAEYEDSLRSAEKDIESAFRAICSLRGEFPRYELGQALEKVRDAICGVYRLYDNPDIEIA